MNISLGEKIKALRKQKNISQETLANYLGLSFQAVSKWENALAMPDVTLIPAIASFFGVSIDDLFDFNLYEIEKNINDIVTRSGEYY
ncbi:MAG: helix-turn-helix transcriptional regulator, partial [Niameybacter sp.]